jgi:hypothetical protein
MSITDQTATYIAVTDDSVKATHSHVTLDDGTEFVVRTGLSKDLIAWDRTVARKYDRTTQVFIFVAFLAWNAARREGFYTGTFDGPGGFLDTAEEITRSAWPTSPSSRPGGGPSYPEDSAARLIVALSIRLRIPFAVLAEEDDEVIATYLDLLEEADRRS